MTPKKIGFLGLGLIGGSIARRLKKLHGDWTLIASSGHAETITEAYHMGLIANASMCDLTDFATATTFFSVCSIQKNIEYLRLLCGNIKKAASSPDVGSVKSDIHREVAALGMEHQFIGGHPMAGSEKAGLSSSRDSLS